ncbi:PH domain-containing protein [Luteipulveratus mongoliensis]|uniref:Cytoplasmic protein n=1 Tax=Luteipulveratus mongoliensis TaxID=571913 RepID=A0A0K1JGH5_9MICO|nr:PH domain-containing protein [Luteipulveratus mongoliensis]AKU15801.1 cytoplasmic protein [Luteipulveratus mongoliensis]
MIDFKNGMVFKLAATDPAAIAPDVAELLIEGEQILSCFKAARDFVVFTNKRLVAVNVQGITGRKRDYTSLPYSKVQAFSIETAGSFDLDSELEIWFSGLGLARLEFRGDVDIRQIGRLLAHHIL